MNGAKGPLLQRPKGGAMNASAEHHRLEEARARTAHWRRWGPYLSQRQWGTVREDYSADGEAWEYVPHEHARSRAYRWGEDGLLGISDNHQRLCFALALWNGRDPILKERLFGLTNHEGNHGEDVKEYYFFLDNTPTHSYMRCLYRYPQRAFPYEQLRAANRARSRFDPEYELIDTGVLDEHRYFDVAIEYAKATPDDILIEITATNRGPEQERLHVLPTLWFRNSWAWFPNAQKPLLTIAEARGDVGVVQAEHPTLGRRWLHCQKPNAWLFTDNETNSERLFGTPNTTPFVKDAFHDFVVHGVEGAVNPQQRGTKAAAHYILDLAPGQARTIRLRLTDTDPGAQSQTKVWHTTFEAVLGQRRREADEFYAAVLPYPLSDDARAVQRRAFAGLLWSKQYYNYVVRDWLEGDPAGPRPPPQRKRGRNHEWLHLYNEDILSMPDTWEYPWYAAWDLGFHAIALALIDPEFAKRQLDLLTREWYMHPNGQLPAYEWSLGDANPPVHAWAAWRVFKIDKKMRGRADLPFLERVFQKLLLNFTWWCNRKDAEGNNIFQGGFLGLDNIGVFDRNAELPNGGHLDQADGTSWMGMYCLNMLTIALELAQTNPVYEDIASKFFEHFLYIADAMNRMGDDADGLWDERDGFYYDTIHIPGVGRKPLEVRSLVGLIPLFAVEPLEPDKLANLPSFNKRMNWFINNRPDLYANCHHMGSPGLGERRLLAIVNSDRLRRMLARMLDESEFLSAHGIRSLSKAHERSPYVLEVDGQRYQVDYEPAESRSGLFGGNSNWRGPVWFPANYLIVESLQKFHYYMGDDFLIECPTGSGTMMTLWEVATELSHRLIDIFLRDDEGRRPFYGSDSRFQNDPDWRDHIFFHEYFHGDSGAGLGASHQTGWTGLVAKLLQQCAEYCGQEKDPL
ncbi:MAG TPA: hypothetical protein VN934_04680 [Candidatus Tumulicola sp.]|nr:hypothetical protein [Candidatus Tumulicola sp.]